MSHEKTWNKLKCLLLNERSQSENSCMIPTILHSGKGKTMGTIKRSVIARSWGEEGTNRWSKGNF